MHDYLKGILVGTALSFSAVCAANQGDISQRPNILLILADDLGYGDLSCQGATDLKTPDIDRIFNEGIRFKNCYANSTVSSPSRAALLTGLYPDLVGVPGVIRTEKNEKEYGHLLRELTAHISLSGSMPWQNPEFMMKKAKPKS